MTRRSGTTSDASASGLTEDWQRWRRLLGGRRPVRARAVDARREGLVLDLGAGVRGYVSQDDLPRDRLGEDPAALVGLELEGLVTGVEPDGRGVLLSPRELAVARCRALAGRRRRIVATVLGAGPRGLIVDIGGFPGLVPRAELRPPLGGSAVPPATGAVWRGYVLRVDSHRALLSDYPPLARRWRAWRQRRALRRLRPGARVSGTVGDVGAGGAFVSLDRGGLYGFIPRGELSWWRSPPEQVVAPGQRVEAIVQAVGGAVAKGTPAAAELSLRAARPNPWHALADALPSGTAVRCRVESLLDEGALVALVDHPPAHGVLAPEWAARRVGPREAEGGAGHDAAPLPGGTGRGAAPLFPGEELWAEVEQVSPEQGRVELRRRIAPERR